MRKWMVVAPVACAIGCGGARPAPETAPPAAVNGVYTFSAATPAQLIRGRIRLIDETMSVEFETTCASTPSAAPMPRGMPSSLTTQRYYCDGVWLTFDRHNPSNGRWFATVQTPKQREVCSRYESQGGRQVCVSRSTETYYESESRSGTVQVQRIP